MQKFTLQDLQRQFPDEDTCLRFLLKRKGLRGRWYRVKGRKAFVNKHGRQVYPLKGTIFERSSTPLTLWFHALYLFSISRNGVSAAELERQLGVTYKCAFRMARQIRSLMKQERTHLTGIVEVDETYIGGKHRRQQGWDLKVPVLGMAQRGGVVRMKALSQKTDQILLGGVTNNVSKKARIMTDEYYAYTKLPSMGYQWGSVTHSIKQWANGDIHTNSLEGAWGRLKPMLKGTYYGVSREHLQSYLDEFCFRANHRSDPFGALLQRL